MPANMFYFYGAVEGADPRGRDASAPRRMNVTRAQREKQLLHQQRKEFQVKSKFQIWCLSFPYVYFGLLISTYVAFTIPLEAMRMAPTWQSGFIIIERMIYGVTHLAAPIFGVISDNTEHPWGKRRPVLAAGAAATVASISAMLMASSNLWVTPYLIAVVFTMIAKNLIISVMGSFLADVVPKSLTSTASSLVMIQITTGCLLGFLSQYACADKPVAYTYVLVVTMYIPAQGIFFMMAREPRTDLSVLEQAGEEDVEFLPEAIEEPDAEAGIAESDAEAPATQNTDKVDALKNAKNIQSKEAPESTSSESEPTSTSRERAAGDRSFCGGIKYTWSAFYNALTISVDYGIHTSTRVCFYAGASSMSMILFFMRDVVGVPSRSEGVHELALVMVVAQIPVLIIAVPASFLFTEASSKASTQKAFMMAGIFILIIVYGAMIMLPTLQKSGMSKGAVVASVYVGGVFYGVSNAVMSIGDMGLALRILPEGVGRGAALSLFGPSTTYGYVVGSLIIGAALSFFAWRPDDKDKPHFDVGSKGPEGALPDKKHAGDSKNLDFDWNVEYKPQGYQVIFLCSIVLLVISTILLCAVNTTRAERAAEKDDTVRLSSSMDGEGKDESNDEE